MGRFVVSAGENTTVDRTEERLNELFYERFQEDEDAYSVSSMNVMEDAIPAAALAEENGASLVYTDYDSKTETLINPLPVETGLSDGDQVQSTSGLQEGNTVWYRYYDSLEIEGLPGGFPQR